MAATALRYLGDQADAKRNLDSMLGQYVPPIQGSHIARFQLDQRAAALEAAKGDCFIRTDATYITDATLH
jgi:hypothetical protein